MANSGAASGVDPEYSVYVGNLNPATTLSDVEDLIYELFLQVSSTLLCDYKLSRTRAIFFYRLVHWIRCSFLTTERLGNTRAMALSSSYIRSRSSTQLT